MPIELEKKEGVLVVKIGGRPDGKESFDFIKSVSAALIDQPRDVVLDLDAVDFVSSWVLAIIVALRQETEDHGRRLIVAKHTDELKLLLLVSGLAEIVQVAESVEDAVEKLGHA